MGCVGWVVEVVVGELEHGKYVEISRKRVYQKVKKDVVQ